MNSIEQYNQYFEAIYEHVNISDLVVIIIKFIDNMYLGDEYDKIYKHIEGSDRIKHLYNKIYYYNTSYITDMSKISTNNIFVFIDIIFDSYIKLYANLDLHIDIYYRDNFHYSYQYLLSNESLEYMISKDDIFCKEIVKKTTHNMYICNIFSNMSILYSVLFTSIKLA